MENVENKSVLIIEDMGEMRSMLKGMIISLGYSKNRIDVESSGTAAIKLIMANHYDVIISDYNLGGNINGQTILEAVRKSYTLDHSTIFIMVTADVSYNCVINILEHEPDTYIIKPFTKADFVRRFDRIRKQKYVFDDLHKHYRAKRFEEAKNISKKIMEVHPHFETRCLKTIGECLLAQNKPKEAKQHYTNVIKRNEQNAWPYYGMAVCEMQLNNEHKAIEYLHKTTSLNKSFLSAYELLSEAQIRLKKHEEAQRTLIDLVKLSPYSLNRTEKLGKISIQIKDWKYVESAYSRMIYLTKETSKEKIAYYYNHLQSIALLTENNEVEESMAKLSEKFRKSISRLRFLGKDDPIVISNSFRVEIQHYIARKRKAEARKSWDKWQDLIRKGNAAAIRESQAMDIRNRLGLDDH